MKDYKKILEGLVNIINNTEKSDIGFANICTFIGENCPELKESEDERIRGAIIDHLKDSNLTEWVAWIEKQGNTNIFDVPKISIKNAVEVTSRMQYIDDDIKPIAEFIMDYANWDLHKDEWNQPTLTVPLFRVLDALIQKGKPYCECNQNIEKQVEPTNINLSEFDSRLNKLLEQFETLPKEELISSLSFYLNVVQNNGTYKSDEKQGQKVDNKVEPKFKVGDWVMLDRPVLITKVEDMPYNTHQYWTSDGTWFGDATKAKLWIIQDAKDGDMLIDSLGNVCIYQEPSTKLMYHSHCYGNHKFFIPMGGSHEIVGSYPATKEQREQLEKSMADAGYTFDFEKKELKEIENEEYDGEDYGIDSLWHAKNILEKTLGKVDGYQTDDGILDHKCAISAVNKLYKEDAKIKNRWKPSDEHIHWLKWVINRMPDTEKANEAEAVLKDLLEQLEEL